MAMTLPEGEDAKLAQGEERYRGLFTQSRDAIFLADAASGILLDVNDAGCRLVGRTREEIIGQPQSLLHPPGERERVWCAFREFVSQDRWRVMETEVIRADGVRVPVEINAGVIRLAGRGGVLQGVFRDLTERRLADRSLKESERKLATIFQHMPDLVTISSIQDGSFRDVNDTFEFVLGFTRDEVVGRSALEIGIWPYPEQRQALVAEVRKNGVARRHEVVLQRKDGQRLDTLFSATIIEVQGEQCLLSMVTDISARREVERALTESEAKFATIFRHTPDLLAISRIEDGVFLDVNDAFVAMLGYSRDEVIGRSSLQLDFWALPEQRAAFIDELRCRGEARQHDVVIRRKDGRLLTMLFSGTVIEVRGEQLFLSMAVDITARREAEEALKESTERLRNLSDNLPGGVIYQMQFLPDGGRRFTYVSAGVESLHGMTAEEVLNDPDVLYD